MYIITSTLCIVTIGLSWAVYTSTSINPMDYSKCSSMPIYRISSSTQTLPGETLYQAVLIGK